MSLRLTTWNIQGRARPDLAAVADVLRDQGADIVALQEVQRRQARALAAGLGWTVVWRWKHWPVVLPAEGLALLTPVPAGRVEVVALAQRWAFWSSDRRIAVAADLTTATGTGVRLVDTHLGAGVGDAERSRQARIVTDLAGPEGIVAGDLNTSPRSSVLETFRSGGLRDAWVDVHDEADRGFTNWGTSPRHEPPVQRLDYVLVGSRVRVVDASTPAFGDPGFERYGRLSDHLPVTVTLEVA